MTDRPQVPDAVERAREALAESSRLADVPGTEAKAATVLHEALRDLLALHDGEVVTEGRLRVAHTGPGRVQRLSVTVEPSHDDSMRLLELQGSRVSVVLRLPEVE